MTPVPGEKIRFHFHSTFPAKATKLEIPHFRTLGNKKRLETEVSSLFSLSRVGGDKRDRTADLLNAIQALSQLSYTPRFTCRRPYRPNELYFSTTHSSCQLFFCFSQNVLRRLLSDGNWQGWATPQTRARRSGVPGFFVNLPLSRPQRAAPAGTDRGTPPGCPKGEWPGVSPPACPPSFPRGRRTGRPERGPGPPGWPPSQRR